TRPVPSRGNSRNLDNHQARAAEHGARLDTRIPASDALLPDGRGSEDAVFKLLQDMCGARRHFLQVIVRVCLESREFHSLSAGYRPANFLVHELASSPICGRPIRLVGDEIGEPYQMAQPWRKILDLLEGNSNALPTRK